MSNPATPTPLVINTVSLKTYHHFSQTNMKHFESLLKAHDHNEFVVKSDFLLFSDVYHLYIHVSCLHHMQMI